MTQIIRLGGLAALNDRIVGVFLAGLDCGDHPVVDSIIELTLPLAEQPLLTERWLSQVSSMGLDFGHLTVSIGGRYTVPCVIGYRYRSRGQRLRPIIQEDTGAAAGPALGKLRRNHRFSALLHNTKGLKIGDSFERLNALQLDSPGGTALSETELFSGVVEDTLDGDSDFDGMLCWENDGTPYPTTIAALGGSLATQDK